jgi:hypothetical protein
MESTIIIKHKIPNGLRTLKLKTEGCELNQFSFEQDGVEIFKLPIAILEKIKLLQTLPTDNSFDMFEVKASKGLLEEWLHEVLPTCHEYSLRHLIVRNSSATKELMQRKQLPVQKPGQYFHIDQEHSDLVNIWLPLNEKPLTDFQLGFIKYRNALLSTIGLKDMYTKDKELIISDFEENATLIYPVSCLSCGYAVVFRSGGENAVVHGSFRFDKMEHQTGMPRTSMEWRCQFKDPINGFGPCKNT